MACCRLHKTGHLARQKESSSTCLFLPFFLLSLCLCLCLCYCISLPVLSRLYTCLFPLPSLCLSVCLCYCISLPFFPFPYLCYLFASVSVSLLPPCLSVSVSVTELACCFPLFHLSLLFVALLLSFCLSWYYFLFLNFLLCGSVSSCCLPLLAFFSFIFFLLYRSAY